MSDLLTRYREIEAVGKKRSLDKSEVQALFDLADAGLHEAQVQVGFASLTRGGGFEPNADVAIQYLLMATESGSNPYVLFELSLMHAPNLEWAHGAGFAPYEDAQKAAVYFEAAFQSALQLAESGDHDAMSFLGDIYAGTYAGVIGADKVDAERCRYWRDKLYQEKEGMTYDEWLKKMKYV